MGIISQDDILIRVRVQGEDAYPRLDKQSRQLGKSTQALGGRMAELGNIVTGIESGFALAARAAATAKRTFDAVSVPVGLAIDFEQQFAQVQTLTGMAGRDLERGLLDLAARVPQTAGDITQAAYQAISAGIDPTEAVQFLDAASKTAVAGATNLTTAVDLLTSAANAYKVQGVDAARASDVLFATVRQGKTTVEELAQSIGQAAPAAAQFGVRIEELGAAAAVLTKQGLSTAEAMTRINALTKALVNPSKSAAKQLKALGVEFGAAALKSKGLTGILQDLRAKTEGNDEALATLFRRFEATQAVVGLLGDGLKGYTSDLDAVTKSTGSVAAANARMDATTQGAINRFKALGEGALRQVGQEALPAVNDAIDRLSASMAGDEGQRIIEGLGTIATGLVRVAEAGIKATAAVAGLVGSITRTADLGLTAVVAEQDRQDTRNFQSFLGLTPFVDELERAQSSALVRAGAATALDAIRKKGAAIVADTQKLVDDGVRQGRAALGLDAPSGALPKPPKPPKPPRGPRVPQAAQQPLIGGLFGAAGGIGGGVSDLLAAGAAGGRGLFDAIEDAERANAERRALLIEDGTLRELALAQLRYEQEVQLAEQSGQDVNLVTQLYARERQRILQDAADMERQSWQMAASEAIGSVESILGSFEAMAGGSKALRAIIMAARGTDYQMKAVGLAADAIAAGAVGNIPQAIGLGAAAAAAEAAAIQHFAKAAGLGGGGGGGSRGGAGGGGGAGRTAGVGGTPRARASDGFSTNGGGPTTVTFNINGPVVGSRNALNEFARDELVPAINTALGRRGGVRLDLGRR